jgi:hypothetical protein
MLDVVFVLLVLALTAASLWMVRAFDRMSP